jgi:hypothetical protein
MKIPLPLATALLLPLLLASCQRDDELAEQGVADEDPGPPPCGGADLQTDNLNCGSCGTECEIMWPGTHYAAGGCVEGECGPVWSAQFTALPSPDEWDCRKVCGFGDVDCVPGGCSDKTAFMCVTVGDFGDQCDLSDPLDEAYMVFEGSCDDPIPYPEGLEPGFYPQYRCCCERD